MKNVKNLMILFLMFSVSLYSCENHEHKEGEEAEENEAQEELDLARYKGEIQAMEDAYAASQNNKNTDGILAYYAEDAKSLANNEPMLVGRAAIIERVERNMANDTTGNIVRFEAMEIIAEDDLVIEIGRSIVTDPDGNQVSTGKYMSVFDEVDGKLVCIRDIYNEDAAAVE